MSTTNKIERCEYTEVNPESNLTFNRPNIPTKFILDHVDVFYDARIQYKIKGKVVKMDGSEYPNTTQIKLIDNFAAFLFSKVEISKKGTIFDTVDHPGITSTVKGLVSYSRNHKYSAEPSGFSSNYKGGGKFEAIGTLGHLGLGFFDSLDSPIYQGGFEIKFIRAEDNDALLHWKGTAATEPEDGKIEIESFVLRVPLVEYEHNDKTILVSHLTELSDQNRLNYNYWQWQCIDKAGVSGTTYNCDLTNLFQNNSHPFFIIIGLQSNRTNNQLKDPSKFDSESIKNFEVRIDGEVYPREMVNVDNDNCLVMYDMYQSFRRMRFRDENCYLSLADFKTNYPLMVIDTSKYPSTLGNPKNKILLSLDFNSAINSNKNVTAYVVIVSPTSVKYDITRNVFRKE